jgi:Predicted transcriptional regulators
MDGSELRRVFSHNLKLMRTRAGLSQLSLANSLNLAPNFISDIECGKKWVSPETLAKLSIALHIEPYQLFIEEQELNAETHTILLAFTDDLTRAIDESINKVRGQYFPKSD